ncbi:MAG: DUF393 domain-containing protein [Planctomycetota bacterium]
MSKQVIFEVFFDKSCPLCAKEIAWLSRRNRGQSIKFTDISSSEFTANNSTGKTVDQLMREIHGRLLPEDESETSDKSKWIIGVDVFREMYDRVGFSTPVTWSRLPIISRLLDFGYFIFAKFRYTMAVKRMKNWRGCSEACNMEDGISLDEGRSL